MKKSILQRMTSAENKAAPVPMPGEPPKEPVSQLKRHSSPVISNVGKALSQLYEESIFALDPGKIERSPFQDRFEDDIDATDALEALKQSIASEGQKIPVLVRPHPTEAGRYQLAYGRRRLGAIKAMMDEAEHPETVKIKAYVRDLTDRQLIEEQSVENGVRENLTWIEQAMWAVQLKNAGLTHRNICPILGLSEAGISQLFRVTSAIPEDIIYAVGRAKSVGRPKWTALADMMREANKVAMARAAVKSAEFKSADGQGRIAIVMRALNSKPSSGPKQGHFEPKEFSVGERHFGQAKHTAKGVTVTIPNEEADFANWLVSRLPMLVREYSQESTRASNSD